MNSSPIRRPRPHALALAGATLCASLAAQAQTTAPAASPVETIVVKGQRASLEKAQDIKRNAEQVVDSIVADDIGKLPDANVAEALQRITGVQVSRNRGEGDRVQVRGLQQNQTLLNGRVIFSAGKGRGLSFQDVPSELLAGADVYKTPTVDLVEGGIGGVIDLRTRRPLDFPGLKVAGTLKGTHADLAKKSNTEGSLLASNRWKLDGGGDFGALVSLSTQRRNYRADTQELDNPAALADGSGTIAPTGQWLAYEFGQRDRRALSTSLQWRPNARSEYTLDWNLSKLDNQTEVQGHYATPFWANFDSAKNQGQLWNNGAVTTDGAGRLVKGEFWGASMSTSGSVADEATQINQLALAGKWKLGSGTTLKSEINHTRSEFERFYQEVRLGSFATSPTYVFDLSTALPSAYSPQAQLANPANYWADKVLYFKIQNHGKETAWKLDVDHGIGAGLISRVKAGVRVSDRQADSTEVNTINDIWMFALSAVPHVGLLPHDDLLRRAGDGQIARQWLSVNNADWLRDANAVRSTFNLSVPSFDPAQTFDFQERSAAVYGAVDFDTSLAGRPLTGNLGLRAVQTNTERSSANLNGGREQADSDETDWLPALNMRWELQRSLIARLALSKVVTRPNFDQLTPSLSLNVNDRTGYRGNPALGQLSANQIDTTLEYYPSSSDHLYGALFHKAVKGFIQNTSTQVTIGGTSYTLTTPNNGADGRISGLEVGYQGFFKTLPGWLSGLGLQANATFVNSHAPSLVDGRQGPLEGLSKQSANLMALYDLGSFSARLAYNWRSDYLVGTRLSYPTNDGKTVMTPVTMKSYGMVDAYFSVNFKPGLKLGLEANNLTRTVRQTHFSDYGLPRGTYVDDRRVALSVHAEL
jgi:TonB-dependent receptor